MNPLADSLPRARRTLSRRDPLLRPLLKAVGPCTLRTNPDGFGTLVRSIVSQMISTKAALVISGRLERELGGLTPEAILAVGEEKLRTCGLSRSKTTGLRDLAGRVKTGLLPLHALPDLPDAEVISLLTPVHGIGVWTAEMFLIFCLGRLDVLPVDDFGLRAGVRDVYGLPGLPGRADLRARGEAWRPYRTVATWYLWKSRGFVPQSD